jgi:hypothetical protein
MDGKAPSGGMQQPGMAQSRTGSGRGHNVSEIGPLITRLCRLENKLADYEEGQGAHQHLDHSHDYDLDADPSSGGRPIVRNGSTDNRERPSLSIKTVASQRGGGFTTKEDVTLIVEDSLTEWHERFTALLGELKDAKHTHQHHNRGASPAYAPDDVDLDDLPDDFGDGNMDAVGENAEVSEEERKKYPAYVFSEGGHDNHGHRHAHGHGHGHAHAHHPAGSPMDRPSSKGVHGGQPGFRSKSKDSRDAHSPRRHEEPMQIQFDLLASKDFRRIQESVESLKKQLDTISHTQHEQESEHSTTHAKLSKFEIANLNTSNMIESLEDTCRKLALAMRDVERNTQQEQDQMRRERAAAKLDLEAFVNESIEDAMARKANGAVDSYTTTKAMCLGCGRNSTVRHYGKVTPDPTTNPNYGGPRLSPSRPQSPEKPSTAGRKPQQDDVDDHLSVMTGDSGGFDGVGAVQAEKSTTIEVEVVSSPAIGGIIQFPVITQPSSPSKVQHIPLIHPAINQQLNRGVGGIMAEANDILQPTLQVERAALDAQRQLLASSSGRAAKPRTASGKRENHTNLPARRVYANIVEDTGGPSDATVNALVGKKSDRAAVSITDRNDGS